MGPEQLSRIWRVKWVTPITDLLFAHSFAEGLSAATAALTELPDSGLPPEEIEELGYLLNYLRLALKWQNSPEQWNLEDFHRELAGFEGPARTKQGEFERLRRRFIIRTHADKDGIEEIEEEVIDELLAQLPPEEITSAVWHYVATWAFKHRNITLLERSFEAHLTFPSEFLGQAKWQRVNLMYQLVTGKISRRDVLESIKLLTVRPQLQEFTNELWPECVKAGVVDRELEEMFEAKAAEVEQKCEL